VSRNRNEFDKKTKRERLAFAERKCEAEGPWYGREWSQGKCGVDLSYGVNFDHLILDANSKDNSFENCRAVCPSCHAWKTDNHDKPLAAKTLRQQDKANGIVKPKSNWPTRRMKSDWEPRVKQLHEEF
jgi:hypothetical protein